MPMYNLIYYSDKYPKTSKSLWQCYKDEPGLDSNGNTVDFADSFRFIEKNIMIVMTVH